MRRIPLARNSLARAQGKLIYMALWAVTANDLTFYLNALTPANS